mgnify:CR=1 FL=1
MSKTEGGAVGLLAKQNILGGIRVGHKRPEAIYVHQHLIGMLPIEVQAMILGATVIAGGNINFNVVKLSRHHPGAMVLMHYADVLADAPPPLSTATTVDLARKKVLGHKVYKQPFKAPLLHCRHEMIPPWHMNYERMMTISQVVRLLGIKWQAHRSLEGWSAAVYDAVKDGNRSTVDKAHRMLFPRSASPSNRDVALIGIESALVWRDRQEG